MWLSRRYVACSLLAGLFVGCVEQEPDRPSEEDKRIIAENILSKAPTPKFVVNADLEGKVTYVGLDVDRDVIQAGEQFTLTHYWKVIQPVEGWQIFVHLNGPEKRGFVNADHHPIGGRYPATRWKAGEVIRDEHKVTLPADYKEDKVMVLTGLWKGKLRMRIKGPQDDEKRIIAATLKVGGIKAQESLKRLVATRTDKPIKLDGKLDEPVWSKAVSSGPFVDTMTGGAVPMRTEVKLAWDDKNLYAAFVCQDEDIWGTFKNRDDKLWTQEAVEFFIDADGDGKDYVELQVSPGGILFDSFLPEYRKNQNDWNSGVKTAVFVDGTLNKREDKDKSWTVELSIPWTDVKGRSTDKFTVPPAVGTMVRANFFRMDQPNGKPQQASGWSPPLVGDFHRLDRFGELALGDSDGKTPDVKAEPAKAATAPTPAAAPAAAAEPTTTRGVPAVVQMKQPEVKTLADRVPARAAVPAPKPAAPAKGPQPK